MPLSTKCPSFSISPVLSATFLLPILSHKSCTNPSADHEEVYQCTCVHIHVHTTVWWYVITYISFIFLLSSSHSKFFHIPNCCNIPYQKKTLVGWTKRLSVYNTTSELMLGSQLPAYRNPAVTRVRSRQLSSSVLDVSIYYVLVTYAASKAD